MALIILRHLPAVAAIEELLALHARGLLAPEEAEELPHLVDDASRDLFGITANDTLYPALPDAVRARFARADWEAQFDRLGAPARDFAAYWRGFGLDCGCERGFALHCLDLFGRQLVCALERLHPHAALTFLDREMPRAA